MNMPFKEEGAKKIWLNNMRRLKSQLSSLDAFRPRWITLLQLILIGALIVNRPMFEISNSTYLLESFIGNIETKKQFVGIDVSHYQGSIDWASVAPHQDFIFIKASDGKGNIDPRFHENASTLENFSVPTGAYHFFEPSDDPIEQADNFLQQINQYTLGLRPVLDIEISSGINPEIIAKNALSWLKHVEDKTGCQPIIYTYSGYWNKYLGKDFNQYSYWLADYNKDLVLPSSRTSWQIWQYTERGRISGLNKVVDQDIIQGTKEEFNKLLCNAA
ncbi:MAG: GH25 family lysozyme [Bermanella sp.]